MTRARAVAGIVVLLALLLLWFSTRERGPGPGAIEPVRGEEAKAGSAPRSPPERSAAESSGTVIGRVIDQFGEPWVDLGIRAGGTEARSGPDGRFALVGLARVELALDLSSDFDPAVPLGERRLASVVPLVAADLRENVRADVGDQVVPRSRPYWIEGALELDPDWAAAKAVTLGDVRIELILPAPEELGHLYKPELTPRPSAPIDWSRPPWRNELPEVPRLSPDGRFRLAVETPHDPFLLRISLRRFEPIERLIVPELSGRFAETFRMP